MTPHLKALRCALIIALWQGAPVAHASDQDVIFLGSYSNVTARDVPECNLCSDESCLGISVELWVVKGILIGNVISHGDFAGQTRGACADAPSGTFKSGFFDKDNRTVRFEANVFQGCDLQGAVSATYKFSGRFISKQELIVHLQYADSHGIVSEQDIPLRRDQEYTKKIAAALFPSYFDAQGDREIKLIQKDHDCAVPGQ